MPQMTRRKLILILAATTALSALALSAAWARDVPKVATGFVANVVCTETFVSGLDPQMILKLVSAGAGNSRVFELRGPMMAAGRYDEATMKISTWQKDMAIIGKFASDLGCPTPLFNASEPVYAAALAGGLGAQDTAAVCTVLEAEAGLKRVPTR